MACCAQALEGVIRLFNSPGGDLWNETEAFAGVTRGLSHKELLNYGSHPGVGLRFLGLNLQQAKWRGSAG